MRQGCGLVYGMLTMVMSCAVMGQAQQAPDASKPADSRTPPPATITGSGTTNYIPRWTAATTLGDSVMFQTGGKIGIGTTTPSVDLDVNGRVNVAKTYRIGTYDVLAMPGGINGGNVAVGNGTLPSVGSAGGNTAVGYLALNQDTAYFNTAVGGVSLRSDTTGQSNTAIGYDSAAGISTGSSNTALGDNTLFDNQTGSSNIAIGHFAGFYLVGDNNVDIASYGAATDNAAIRIGDPPTHTSFFVAGVRGITTGMNDAVPVVIDSNGQLGTVNSSRRFKEDIQDMGATSEGLMRLRPVTFRYQKAFGDGSKPVQYGLIAEEVAQVYPDLVAHSADGQVETVKYQVLDAMLLNEVQRQQKEIRLLEEELAEMKRALAGPSSTETRRP